MQLLFFDNKLILFVYQNIKTIFLHKLLTYIKYLFNTYILKSS